MNTDDLERGPYLRWIVACDYYDGAMTGIGERTADGILVWFTVVAWDEEQWLRVFAITTVDPECVGRLISELERVELRRLPFWLPGPASATPVAKDIWSQLANEAIRSDRWWLVEAHDLNEVPTQILVPTSGVPRLVASVRGGSVLTVRGSSITDELLRGIGS